MAEASWPSPNHNARSVTDGEYEKIAAQYGDGVFGDPTGTAVVSAGIGLQVVVRANVEAVLRGHYWTSGTTDFNLSVASNSSGQTRYDWIVLRLDRSTWDVTAAIHQGTPGAGRPTVTRSTGSTGVYEMTLGYVQIDDSATSVTVVPWTQYIGSRIRPCTSTTHTAVGLGGIEYEQDTGRWTGWNGNSRVTIYQDSGELILSGWFDTWTADADNIARMLSGVVTLRLALKRVSYPFNSDDPTGSKIGVLPAAVRPGRYQYGVGSFSNGAVCRIEVRPSGEIWAYYASKDVPAGKTLYSTITYIA